MLEVIRAKRRYRFTAHADDPSAYLEKINKFKQECGCSMGAMFTVLALLTCIVRAFTLDWATTNMLVYGLKSMLFIFIAGGIGKILGISIARFRLQLLFNQLLQKHYLEASSQVEKGVLHVNLYKMGR